MKKIICLFFYLSVGMLSGQVLNTKDSCITTIENPKIFKSEYFKLKVGGPENKFLLFTNRNDFLTYFKWANSKKRDSILEKLDLDRNNVIVFYATAGGCVTPEIIFEYFSHNHAQIKIMWNGRCAMNHVLTKYILIPKSLFLPVQLKICNAYPS